MIYTAQNIQSSRKYSHPIVTAIAILSISLFTTPSNVAANDWQDPDFICHDTDSILTDSEILDILREHIISNWVAAKDLEIPSISQMQANDSDCCFVTRDAKLNPWKRSWERDGVTWWRRLFFSPKLFAVFSFEDGAGNAFVANGLVDTCGYVEYMSLSVDEGNHARAD